MLFDLPRTLRLFLVLLALLPAAAVQASEAAGQPPRRGGYPDRSSSRASTPRWGISFHTGYRALHIQSPLFDDNEYDFGTTARDFLAARYGIEFHYAVVPQVDILLGYESGNADTTASYLDLTYEDGSEIEHDASLTLQDLTLGVRIGLAPASALFRPYLLAGFSGALYEYSEVGEFVDFETSDIFYDEFQERSFLPGFFAGGGADFAIVRRPDGQRLELFGEFRYARSAGEHQDGFKGFGDLTLGRSGALFGVRFRF